MASLGRYAILLRPIACLYGLVIGVRNWLFDRGVLRSETYPIPIICVGNISVGGTGKTPHVEYILAKLCSRYRVAVLSRGYKRTSRGMVEASEASSVYDIGDEPLQLKLKYPAIRLIADGNRRRAMRYLLSLPLEERPEVVVMDDGLQHRYVKPSCAILLIDSQRPILEDRLLPEGRLRESASARYRADIIVATKCPSHLSPIQQRIVERSLRLYSHQKIFFSRIAYRALRPLSMLTEHEADTAPIPKGSPLYVISGIANPKPLIDYLSTRYEIREQAIFPDHHNFSSSDITELNACFARLQASSARPVYCVCTEKDAVRLWELRSSLSLELLEAMYYQPIQIEFVGGHQEFDRQIQLAARGL